MTQLAQNDGKVIVNRVDLPKPIKPFDRKMLFVGIKDSSGTATELELKKDITSILKVREFFGRGSHIASGLEYAVNFANTYSGNSYKLRVSGIATNNASGTQSTGSIELDGTATAEGTISFKCGSQKNIKTISVLVGETATAIIAKIETILNADLDLLFTSEVDGVNDKKLNLTANQKGKFLETTKLAISGLPAGITLTALTQFTGGAYTDLTNLTALKTAIEDEEFDLIVFEKDLFTIDNSLIDFFNTRALIQDNLFTKGQVLFADVNSTETNITNSLKQKVFGVSLAIKETYELPYRLITEVACKKEIRLVLGSLQNAVNIMQSAGGVKHSTRGFTGVRSGLIDVVDFAIFNKAEQKSLNEKGFLTLEMNENGLAIYTGNRSMYIEDENGNPTQFNEINDFEKMSFFMRQFFDLAKTYKHKTLKGVVVDPEFDLSKAVIKGDCERLIDQMGSFVEYVSASGLIEKIQFGIITNDETTKETMKNKINESVDNLQLNSKVVELDILGIIVQAIETIGFTTIFSK